MSIVSLNNNSILFVANQFPPEGGAGVQRTSKFVKYLPLYGYKPIVITKTNSKLLEDHSLLKDIDPKTSIYRLKSYNMLNKRGLLYLPFKFIGRKLMVPDAEYFWYIFNRRKVLKLVENEKINLIYTTSYPYSSHLLGLYIKKKCPDKIWVVDFRDEWTNNPFYSDKLYGKIKLKIEKPLEKKVLRLCDHFITVSKPILINFIKEMPSLQHKSSLILNGYDDDDYKNLDTISYLKNKLIFIHSGSLYGRRTIDDFLSSLNKNIQKENINPNDIEVHIVGNIYEKIIENYIEKYNMKNIIKRFGYLSHSKSIQKLYDSDVLLLIIGKGKGSQTFYTGKIFEYIRTGKPILAFAPKGGVAADLIRQTNTGFVVETDQEIDNAILNIYNMWKNNELVITPNWREIKKYNRKSQAEQLSKILDKLKKDK